jgi:hypothetical protein
MHASVAYIQVTTEKHAATPHPTTPLYAPLLVYAVKFKTRLCAAVMDLNISPDT